MTVKSDIEIARAATMKPIGEVRQRKWFGEEIDRAALDCRDSLDHAAAAGDDDAPDFRISGKRRVEDDHPIRIGQPQIENQSVVGKALQARQRVGCVAGLGNGESFRFK